MADITMCNAKNCKDKELCYRFTAVPDPYWQSVFDPSLEKEMSKDTCEHYLKGRRRIVTKDKEVSGKDEGKTNREGVHS